MVDGKSISLCMVVYNSSDLVERAINSVKSIVDEIIIVSQGSDEEHSKKLKELSNVFIQTSNKGNADYDRQFAYSLASKDFTLALDADESLEETEVDKLKQLITDHEFDSCWFLFKNIISSNGITIDLQNILGDDPHPRLWRSRLSINGQIIPTIEWSYEAHQFPRINSPMQVFSQIKFTHSRELENVLKTHFSRGKNISPQAQQMEKKFVKTVLDKFGEEVKKNVKIKFPEITEYLKGV